jgi:adenylosuccinate synthase
MNRICIVVGLGFGDEGKGATVNALCSNQPSGSLVVRFNGGHQVGHTVRVGDLLHAFSNFGSGSLQGVPTYWTEYCTVNPVAVIKEGLALLEKGIIPKVYYNANAMVTTPFDIVTNIVSDSKLGHGTVGVGFGTTIKRNEEFHHLYVRDLLFPAIRDAKLKAIMNYYGYTTPLNAISQKNYDNFIDACTQFIEKYDVVENFKQLDRWGDDLIFEGGQGILLDMEYGFFPHVTRSYCTSRNAMEFIRNNGLSDKSIETYYVTRAYQTRHGNGPMTNEGMDISYITPNPKETNVDTGYQGIFRRSVLDYDLLKYALRCDLHHNPDSKKTIVFTCLDQVKESLIPVTKQGVLQSLYPTQLANWLGIFNVKVSNSDKGFLHS